MSDDLERLADLVRRESGIDVRGGRLRTLAAAIAKVAPGMDAGAVLRATADGSAGASLKARLIEAMAVHETYFLRQRGDLDTIDWQRLLQVARAAGSSQIRVWVAACSTGEEAYSVGLLAARAFGSGRPPVSILATDISAAALLRAEAGRYNARSARRLDTESRSRFFTTDGDTVTVGPELRALVEFRRHNLVHGAPPRAPFELVLCRNVLIYFEPATVERVVAGLQDTLVDGGSLVLGAADRLSRPSPARRRGAVPAAAAPEGPAASCRGAAPAGPSPDRSWRQGRAPAAAAGDLATVVAQARVAVDRGAFTEAVALADSVLARDPLQPEAQFVRGLALLEQGRAHAAAEALRRAVYVDPAFALAAFALARAYEAAGDEAAARRAHAQALRTLDQPAAVAAG